MSEFLLCLIRQQTKMKGCMRLFKQWIIEQHGESDYGYDSSPEERALDLAKYKEKLESEKNTRTFLLNFFNGIDLNDVNIIPVVKRYGKGKIIGFKPFVLSIGDYELEIDASIDRSAHIVNGRNAPSIIIRGTFFIMVPRKKIFKTIYKALPLQLPMNISLGNFSDENMKALADILNKEIKDYFQTIKSGGEA